MQLKAIIGLAVALTVALLVFQITRLEKKLDARNETIGIQAASIVGLEATIKHQRESIETAEKHRNELDQLRQANAGRIESISNELAAAQAKNYSIALKAPVAAGDDITRWLSWWMCEKARAGSADSGTCDIHAKPSEDAAVNFAQIHTPKTAEDLREACRQGIEDACEFVLVAFTWSGWHNFQNYLMKDLLATQALYANDEYFRRVLDSNEEEK